MPIKVSALTSVAIIENKDSPLDMELSQGNFVS